MTSNIKTIRFLTTAQVMRLHSTLIASAKPTQPFLLDSAVQSPKNINYYENQQNLFQLAASLSERIMKNHAYADGNKRTALIAADMFLKINSDKIQQKRLQCDDVTASQSLANAQVAVCTDAWTAEELGQYYEELSTAGDESTLYGDKAVRY